nr:Down syndrome cell adhesion molecule homolog [Penaeus vannamei]
MQTRIIPAGSSPYATQPCSQSELSKPTNTGMIMLFLCGEGSVFDQKELTCVEESTAIPCQESSSYYYRNEEFVAPTWKVEPEDASVVVGEDLLLPCAANGSPTPTITWRRAEGAVPRQYRPVTSLGDNVRVSSNSSLIVQNIKRNQGGEFLCSASNDVGSDLSKSIRVTVRVTCTSYNDTRTGYLAVLRVTLRPGPGEAETGSARRGVRENENEILESA